MELRGYRRLTRDINENLVFTLIHRFGPISRTDLVKISRLSFPTVSAIVRRLIQMGFVVEVGEGESRGGRKPVLLQVNPSAGHVVGVKLMEDSLVATVIDLNAQILSYRSFGLGERSSPTEVLEEIRRAVEAIQEDSKLDPERLLGIGIGLAGVVDSERGVLRFSPFFGWKEVDIVGYLQRSFLVPVYVDNDVNTLTVAEQWFGKGRGRRNFIVVTVGRGVGAGIVANGAFYRGSGGGAGELGHVSLSEDGPVCHCGKRGCLGTVASDPAVEREVSRRLGRRVSFDEVVKLADSGDPVAREALARSGRYLGMGIAAMVNLLNPELVIVSGEGLRAGRWRQEAILEALREYAFDGLIDDVEVVFEPIGDEFWARGAAALVLEKLFRPPVHRVADYVPLESWKKGGEIGEELKGVGKKGYPSERR